MKAEIASTYGTGCVVRYGAKTASLQFNPREKKNLNGTLVVAGKVEGRVA